MMDDSFILVDSISFLSPKEIRPIAKKKKTKKKTKKKKIFGDNFTESFKL